MKVICIEDSFYNRCTGLFPTYPCPKKDEICDVVEVIRWDSQDYYVLAGYGDKAYIAEAFAPIGTNDEEIKLVEIKEEELEMA